MQQPKTNQLLVVTALGDGASHAAQEVDTALWMAQEYFEAALERLEAVAANETADRARMMLDGLQAARTALDLATRAAGIAFPAEHDERYGWDVADAAIRAADKARGAVEAPQTAQ